MFLWRDDRRPRRGTGPAAAVPSRPARRPGAVDGEGGSIELLLVGLGGQAIQRTDVIFLGQRLQAEILAEELMVRSQRQGGGELLADEGAARRRHRFDPRRPTDMATEIVILLDDLVVALEDRAGVQTNAN